VARDAVGLLCEALTALGDRHAVFAFSGEGRDQVDFAVVKDFDEAWSPRTGAALAAVQPRVPPAQALPYGTRCGIFGRNPRGASCWWCCPTGIPRTATTVPIRTTPATGWRTPPARLREAERAGVTTFNISVDAAANDYLRRMCPPKRYWVVDDVDELPARMLALYKLMAV
jgi:nitric oxide reductase NorD protein